MASSTDVTKLVRFIRLRGIVPSATITQGYGHMGATLCDSILQAGLNYDTVVRPRITWILNSFPNETTTSRLLDLVDELGAARLLNWSHPEKPSRLIALANFFYVRSIETEHCLREWLQVATNGVHLESVRGVGPKTVDYLKMLVGIPAIAVDRHIKNFVNNAGIKSNNYKIIREVVECAADELRVHRTNLDYAIWFYVSKSQYPERVQYS